MLKRDYWKFLTCALILYAIIAGFLVELPETMIGQTMRNLFFHVGMWFGMFAMLVTSFIYSLRYLGKFDEQEDIIAVESANVGLMFGVLGILTGMLWARFTWGSFWVKDPKLNGVAVGMFIYLAYMVLRGSVEDIRKRAKIGAAYNIFAFILWIVFVLLLPRLSGDSIHPGSDGSTVLPKHLEPSLQLVFYPAMAGWILLGFWILQLKIRIRKMTNDKPS